MRTLTPTLEAEQKKPSRTPVLKVEVQEFGHPVKSASIQWELFAWEKIFGSSDAQNFHGLAFPSDGSLNRIRLSGTAIHHQRVTSPDENSTYTSWNTGFGNTIANSHLAIAAHGAQVMVAAAGASSLYRRQSSNHGASWGSWINMTNARPCERGCAIAYKANGDCIIVHASDVNDPTSLYVQKRTGGGWSTGLGQRGSYDGEIEALTAYHDGDWNIIALVLEGNYLSVVRMIYGDGDQVAVGAWGTDQKISLARARVDFATQLTLRQFKTGWSYASRGTKARIPTYWERHQAVIEALAGEAAGVSGPSLWKPSSYSALLSLARGNTPWVYRLKAGSEFINDQWTKATMIPTSAGYGLALSDDGTYLWATQANEVWRCLLPSSWAAPTAGSGAGSLINLPISKISRISQTIDPGPSAEGSELEVELDNSGGDYDSPGEGDIAYIKRGSRVNLHIGYHTNSDETEEVGRYFIESWEHSRSPGKATYTLHAIDAWGLLERYAFNKPIEWNVDSDDFTVYQLIDKVLEAVDADLSYKSKSSLIDSLYPRFDVHAGETAASVISRLLALVPDVIFFFGLQGYIIYPQADDAPTYDYKFPGDSQPPHYSYQKQLTIHGSPAGAQSDYQIRITAHKGSGTDVVGEKLVGAGDYSPSGSSSAANFFVLSKFQADETGYISAFRMRASGSANVKVAIYADNAGEPGNLLAATNGSQAVSDGWNTLHIPTTSIVKDAYYWLAFNSDEAVSRTRSGSGFQRRYKAVTYSTFTFPNPAGGSLTNPGGGTEDILAAWSNSVHIYLNDHCLANFNDVRFTDAGGLTFLDFWREEVASGDYAVFCVKIPSIPTSPNTVPIHVFYDYPDATSADDAASVFIQSHGPTSDEYQDELISLGTNIRFRAKVKITAETHNVLIGICDYPDINNFILIQSYSGPNQRNFQLRKAGSSTIPSEAPDFDVDTYYIVEFLYSTTEAHGYVDGNEIEAGSTTNLPTANMGLRLWITTGTVEQEWSVLGKYIKTEPLIIICGSEAPNTRHIILDGQYITETPEVNRAYVIGRDAEGNPVHGTDLEQSEIDLVGERLDFQQHLSIPTIALAADVADAMLQKQRLGKHRGCITIPPNCGAELWDVIQVTDTPCAQSASKYRIVAISFDYEPRQRRYQHKLFLAAR